MPSTDSGPHSAAPKKVWTGSPHGPDELCDCPSPRKLGRPYHCAAPADSDALQDLMAWTQTNWHHLVRKALSGEITKHRLHELTGIARTTIDRILADTATLERFDTRRGVVHAAPGEAPASTMHPVIRHPDLSDCDCPEPCPAPPRAPVPQPWPLGPMLRRDGVIVLGVCGHWWEEYAPAEHGYTPGEARACLKCKPDDYHSVRPGPIGTGMVPVGYLTLWELLGDTGEHQGMQFINRKTVADWQALRDNGSDKA